MQIFKELVAFLAEVPAWIPLILCPALAVLAAAAFALFGGRRAYPVLAGILGAAGVAFMSASATVGETLVYAALFALVACLAGLSRLAPKLKKRRRRTARDERIYEAFRAELKKHRLFHSLGQLLHLGNLVEGIELCFKHHLRSPPLGDLSIASEACLNQ